VKTIVNTAVFCALSAFLSLAPMARANTLNFTVGISACCGSGPFGTVTLTQNGVNDVLVTETLNSGIGFVKNDAGDALDFSIIGDPTISIFHLTSGFIVATTPKSSSYGPFNYAVHCSSACGSGTTAPYFGTLSFDVVATGLTPESFIASAHGYYFASDIINKNVSGNPTGNVAAGGFSGGNSNAAPAVPEPASLFLSGAGLIALGLLRKPRFLTSRSAQSK
jgi:hypothetical protein